MRLIIFFTEANWLNWLALVSVQNNGARKQTLIGQVMAFVVVSQPILRSHSPCSATAAAAAIGAANCLIKKKNVVDFDEPFMCACIACLAQVVRAPRLKRYGVWTRRTLTTSSKFRIANRMIFCEQYLLLLLLFLIHLFRLQASSRADFPLQVAARWRACRVDSSGFKARPDLLCQTGIFNIKYVRMQYAWTCAT